MTSRFLRRMACWFVALLFPFVIASSKADDKSEARLDLVEKEWKASCDAWNNLEVSGTLETFNAQNTRLYDASFVVAWSGTSYRFELTERQVHKGSPKHDRVVVISDGETILKASFGSQYRPIPCSGDVYSFKNHGLRSVAHTFLFDIYNFPSHAMHFPDVRAKFKVDCTEVNDDLLRCSYTVPIGNAVTVDVSRRYGLNVIRCEMVASPPSTAFGRYDLTWKEIDGKWFIETLVHTGGKSSTDFERDVVTIEKISPLKSFDRGQVSMDTVGLLDDCRIIDRRKTSAEKFRIYHPPEKREKIANVKSVTISEMIATLPAR